MVGQEEVTEQIEYEGDERRRRRGGRATGRIDFSLNTGMGLRGGERRGLVGGKAPPLFS